MKTVFHKSGGRQMYQSAARSFRKESTASCRFFAGIHMGAGCASRFASFAAAQRRTAFFYRPR